MVASNVLAKVILVFITVSFMLNEISNYLISNFTYKKDYVAEVNGQKIDRMLLNHAVQKLYNQQQKISKSYNQNYVRQQILSRLIDETLIDQYADKLRLFVSNDKIKDTIFSIHDFYKNDKFDREKFCNFIKQMGISLDQYISIIRKQLITKELVHGIGDTGFLLPSEIDRLLMMAVQTRKVRLAKFDIKSIAEKQIAKDDEIQKSYCENKNKYIIPELFKVNYIQINADNFLEKMNVDKQEIQNLYEENIDQFIIPGCKRYRIIQCKNKEEANILLKQINQGANFLDLAKNHSIDIISAKNNGDIGWISDSDTIDELKQANLNKLGQISDVIKSSLGFFIIRLDDIRPANIIPINSVYNELAEKLKKKKSIDVYHYLQKKVSDAVNVANDQTLTSIEVATGIKAQQTDWFSYDKLPKALNYKAVKNFLFHELPLGRKKIVNNNSYIISVDNNHTFIIRIIDYRPEHIQSLHNVLAKVKQEVKLQKALKLAQVCAEKAVVALNNHKKDDSLQIAGLRFSSPQIFDSLNQEDLLTKNIFKIPQPDYNQSNYIITNDNNKNIVIVALDCVKPKILDIHQRNQFINQLNNVMTDITFDTLLTNLRAKAQIKMNTEV